MDPAAFEKLLQYITHQRHYVDYGFVAALSIVLYDYFLTFPLEVLLVWLAPMSYTSVLFFLVRYIPMISLCLDIPNRLLVGITPERCDWSFPMAIWLLTIGVVLAEIVLAIRTWAVWRRSRIIGAGLSILFLGMVCTAGIVDAKYQKSLKFSTPPYREFRGCFAVAAGSVLQVNFIILTAVDCVVFTLMAISAFQAYRMGSASKLMAVIHRDGLLFYIYLLGATIVNVLIMELLPTDLQQLVTPICCALYSVLTSRIVLNIRQAAKHNGGVSTELHGFHTGDVSARPMEFERMRVGESTSVGRDTFSFGIA